MNKMQLNYQSVLMLLGGYVILKCIYRISQVLYRQLIRRQLDLQSRYGKGTWVLVTGASDGIGKTFSIQLAKQGFNVVLVARNKQKLEEVQKEIKKISQKIQTRIIIADFSNQLENDFYKKIQENVRDIDVSILINNIGVDDSQYFLEQSESTINNLLLLNAIPPVQMTKLFLPIFLKRQGRSAIINVASSASLIPVPYIPVYSAAKALVRSFSQAIELEFQSKIDVMSLNPFYVKTKMNHFTDQWDAITTEQCVDGALKHLGQDSDTCGHWKHAFQGFIMNWTYHNLPKFIRDKILCSASEKLLKNDILRKIKQKTKTN